MLESRSQIPTILNGALNVEGLCLVHCTRYLPTINSDGSIGINSTYLATDGQKPRNTIHFTLNHKVGSHSNGSWEDTPYAMIAPFQDMLDKNGPPPTLMTVDTFWPTNARDPLHIPNATLVMPSDETDDLISINGNVAIYKIGNYTAEDEATLCAKFGDQYIEGCSYEKISEITNPEKREQILRELAHKYAIDYAIQARGFQVEDGNEWSWQNKGFNLKMLEALAKSIGSKNCLPHMNTQYKSMEDVMFSELSFANFLEASAGIDGKTLIRDDGYIYMYDKNHALLCHGDSLGFDIRARVHKQDGNEKSLSNVTAKLLEAVDGLDPKTREVVMDFSDKIRIRIANGLDAFACETVHQPTVLVSTPPASSTGSTRFSKVEMSSSR